MHDFVLLLIAALGGAGIATITMSAMVSSKLDYEHKMLGELKEKYEHTDFVSQDRARQRNAMEWRAIQAERQLVEAQERIHYAQQALTKVNVEYFGPRACIMAANTALDGGHTTGQEEGERSP